VREGGGGGGGGGGNCLNESKRYSGLIQRTRIIYTASPPLQTGGSEASTPRPVKSRFFSFAFLSLQHQKQWFRQYFYFFICSL